MYWIRSVTFANPHKARQAVKTVLQKRLIACTNSIPKINSSYR
ncbi:divalent cation tolerance protein CutA [Candidatus Micrarchaeota archaeon]|nr:divalent cation tolerance protein CutA [Candidatus Micrarchaeota archaeon]MBU1930399.1 divalent cation tolerance protein CutA [Candidatus Micrarchaeota archaeon]